MTTNTQQNEFIQSLDGDLTPEQAAQLLELADMGDTGTELPDNGGVPSASTGEGGEGTAGGDAELNQPGTEEDPASTVVLAKDGKHTIPYEKLAQAREGERHWKAQAEAAQRQLEELQAQSQARADAGEAPTVMDNQVAAAQAAIDMGVDPGIFGDFSEEALAKGIATLVAAQVEARIGKAMEPLKAKEMQDATQSHYDAIYAAHPDADSIAESKELADWIASQPSFVRSSYGQVLERGTTTEVIEFFDRFKQATGQTQQQAPAAANPDAVKAAAKAAIANAPAVMPASLTDFPGGRPAGLTREEAMAGMEGREMLDSMMDMRPEQIEDLLNRLG